MGFGKSKSTPAPANGSDGLPKPTVTSVTPSVGNPIPRNSVAVEEKLSEPQKGATLLANDEDELLRKGVG